MLNDPRFQEIEAEEHKGQSEEDGDESSGENRGSEVGAEATPIHEKTDAEMNGRLHLASKIAVHRYMRQWRPLKPLKLRMQPKLTAAQKQKQKRLDFAKAHINWSIRHWRRVLLTLARSGGGGLMQPPHEFF